MIFLGYKNKNMIGLLILGKNSLEEEIIIKYNLICLGSFGYTRDLKIDL
ncbi:hypothetical protein [Psychrilyobacter atlanticus]|nr:hypothetical protein [Psychrilyobacter atlanticus]